MHRMSMIPRVSNRAGLYRGHGKQLLFCWHGRRAAKRQHVANYLPYRVHRSIYP